jgi:MFS family permease
MMLQSASTNTILQTIVDEEMRGRVMAFYAVAVLGTQPIGSLLAGVLADRIGTQHTIFAGAVVIVIAAFWFAVKRPMLAEHIRPIYIERGILPMPDVSTSGSMQ